MIEYFVVFLRQYAIYGGSFEVKNFIDKKILTPNIAFNIHEHIKDSSKILPCKFTEIAERNSQILQKFNLYKYIQ